MPSFLTGRLSFSIFTWSYVTVKQLETLSLNFSDSSIVRNPCQSSPSLTIFVLLLIIIISLVIFYLVKVLFSGFLHLQGTVILNVAKITQNTVTAL